MSFERNVEAPPTQQTATQYNAPDMAEVAKLGSASAYAPPKPNFDQLLSHDTFPNVGFSDSSAGKPAATKNDQVGASTDAGTEKPTAANKEQNGLQKFMTQALSAASKIHAALGVDMSAGGKPPQNSGCPAAGLRNALSGGGGGSGNSGSQNG